MKFDQDLHLEYSCIFPLAGGLPQCANEPNRPLLFASGASALRPLSCARTTHAPIITNHDLSSDLFDSHLDLDTCLDTESRRHIGMLGVPCRRPDDCA